MEFRFETDYNLETLTAMAKGLRQTVRKKRSRRTRIFAGIILVIGLVSTALSIASKEPLRARNLLVPLAMLNVIYASLRPAQRTCGETERSSRDGARRLRIRRRRLHNQNECHGKQILVCADSSCC